MELSLDVFKQLSKFTSTDQTRAILTGIFASPSYCCATNGHIAVVAQQKNTQFSTVDRSNANIALPYNAKFNEMSLPASRYIGYDKVSKTYTLSCRNPIKFDGIATMTPDAYPYIENVLPNQSLLKNKIIFSEDTIKPIEWLAQDDSVLSVSLFVSNNELIFITNNISDKRYKISVPLSNASGFDTTVHLFTVDPKYLMTVWDLCLVTSNKPSLTITFEKSGTLIPMRFDITYPKDKNTDVFGVIMPIEVKENYKPVKTICGFPLNSEETIDIVS